MIRPAVDVPLIYLCAEPIDFRRGMHSLAVFVESTLQLDPFSSHLFAFCNRRRTSIKLLAWDKNGFIRAVNTGNRHKNVRINGILHFVQDHAIVRERDLR